MGKHSLMRCASTLLSFWSFALLKKPMKLSCWKACCRKHWMKGRVIHLTCCGPRIKNSGPKLPAQWFGLSLILQARWCKFQTLQNTWRWMPVFLFQVGALWNLWNRATWKRSRRSQNFKEFQDTTQAFREQSNFLPRRSFVCGVHCVLRSKNGHLGSPAAC